MQTLTIDGLGQFLETIGKKPLLTREQEILLSRKIQAMVAIDEARTSFLENKGYTPNNEELANYLKYTVEELNKNYSIGVRAKKQLIEHNLKLVVSIAKNYVNHDIGMEDLIQEGCFGLDRATVKFDPSKGCKFSTYATWWIRQSIIRSIHDKCRIIRLPLHITEAMNKVKKAASQLYQNDGQYPSFTEIDALIGWESGKAAKTYSYYIMASKIASIDKKVGREEDTEIINLISKDNLGNSYTLDPLEAAMYTRIDDVDSLLDCLNPKEKQAICLYFGLTEKEMSLAGVGERLNLSRERVRQIINKAIKKLQKNIKIED
ncbi:RNA polymerase, sigma 70 subunit, RpoD subfamily (plasmid) [Calothrix sp. PCC 7716]|nr:RNA polymerase, sigma 70 subunit, RpoD subfamily [Calothrix sp. PCC 7716]